MDVIYACCCGLDIHKKTVAACLMTSAKGQPPTKEVRTFRTMTAELWLLADWLQAAGCTHVAMESTGVYWRPVYNLLKGLCTLLDDAIETRKMGLQALSQDNGTCGIIRP